MPINDFVIYSYYNVSLKYQVINVRASFKKNATGTIKYFMTIL